MKRLLIWLIIVLIATVGIGYYALLFGNEGQSGAICVFDKTLGWQCPGCGGQRAVAAILHGNFIEALFFNPLIYVYIALVVYLVIILVEGYLLKNQKVIDKMVLPVNFGYIFLGVLILFTVVRNLV